MNKDKRNNKKGMLLAEETLKTVIAVIVIVFLVSFLANLYFGKLKDDAIKKSEQILIKSDQSIKNVIERLKEGESQSMILQEVYNWHLFSFTGNLEKPNSCSGKNCLCICDEVSEFSFVNQINECNKNGVCTIVSNLKNEEVNIELQKDFSTEILISKQNNEVSIK